MHFPPHDRAENTILVVAGRSWGVGGCREKWIPGTGAPILEGLRHSYDGGGGRGVESCDFRWEVLIIDDFMYDFRWEVLKFTISTSHFMTCFEGSLKKMFILWCVLKETRAKHRKLRM